MLYISRQIDKTHWGVVDTEDGVETPATIRELKYYLRLGLEVKGVVVSLKNKFIRVEPYQSDDFVSARMAKLTVMSGVVIRVYNDEITGILVPKPLDSLVYLRLSDYASVCGRNIFTELAPTSDFHIVVILDDKIKVNSATLNGFLRRGVALDIREVHSVKVLDYVVYELAKHYFVGVELLKTGSIIADKSVIDYLLGEILLRIGIRNYDVGKDLKYMDDASAVSEKLAKRHWSEFMRLTSSRLVLKSGHIDETYVYGVYDFVRWLKSNYNILESKDYKQYSLSRIMYIQTILRQCSTLSVDLVIRFECYLAFFETPRELKDAFVEFAYRSCKWLLATVDTKEWKERCRDALHQ